MGLFLRKINLLRRWGWLCFLNWIVALTLSPLLKLPLRKLEPWFVLWSFFLLRLHCIYKSTILSCMEYCCHVWAGAPICCLKLLDKLHKRKCRTVGPSLAASFEPLAHRWNVASLNLFYRYYFDRYPSELVGMVSLPFSWGRSTCYSDRLHVFLSLFLDNARMSISTLSFPTQIGSWILCQ